MAADNDQPLIAALDIGSSKVSALIVTVDPDGRLLEFARDKALLLVLDGVQDPHNLGACLRSAAAAGVTAVVIPKDRAVQMNATVRKVAPRIRTVYLIIDKNPAPVAATSSAVTVQLPAQGS